MATRRTVLAAVLLPVSAALAACGGSSSGPSYGSAGSSPSPPPSSPPSSAASGPSAGSSTGSTAGGGPGIVTIQNFAFTPKTVTIAPGTTVTWTNKDTTTHTVTSAGKTFNSGDLATGKSFSFVFPKAGTYRYICSIHPFMTGQVIVR